MLAVRKKSRDIATNPGIAAQLCGVVQIWQGNPWDAITLVKFVELVAVLVMAVCKEEKLM